MAELDSPSHTSRETRHLLLRPVYMSLFPYHLFASGAFRQAVRMRLRAEAKMDSPYGGSPVG